MVWCPLTIEQDGPLSNGAVVHWGPVYIHKLVTKGIKYEYANIYNNTSYERLQLHF